MYFYFKKKSLQEIKIQFRKIFVFQNIILWGRWLQQQKRILALLLLVGIVFKFTSRRPRVVILQGEIMHTPYRIQYLDRWGRNYQQEIDALLVQLHQSLSTSLPDSELSRFNEHDCSEFYFESSYFYPVLAKSKEIYRNTAGAFDPTILPLGNAWKKKSITADPEELSDSSHCEYVGLDYIVANAKRNKKLKEGIKLDFRGILNGYAVDQLAALLRIHVV